MQEHLYSYQNKNDVSIGSHYGTQRKQFIENCKKSLKLFNNKLISKPKRKQEKFKILSKMESEFYKTLYACIYNGETHRLYELLHNKSLNLEKPDKYGNTPLSICAQIGNYEIMKVLIEHGANVNGAHNIYGNTPLHYAIEYNFDNITTLLIKNGADQLVKNNEGKSPWEGA